jgi:hypothetical protein
MLNYYINHDTEVLSTAANSATPLTKMTAKRLTTFTFAAVFTDSSGNPITLPEGSAGVFVGMNPAESAGSGDYVVRAGYWTPPVEQGGGYAFSVDLWGTELDAIATDSNGNRTLNCEIYWTEPDSFVGITQTFQLVVGQNLYQGGELPGDPAPLYPLPANIATVVATPSGLADFSTLPNQAAPPSGAPLYLAIDNTSLWVIAAEQTSWQKITLGS